MEQKAAFDEANPQLARLRGRNYPHKRMPSMYAVSRSMFRRFSAAHMTPEEIANFRGVLLRHLPLIESMFSVNINVYRRQREPVYRRGRSAGPRGARGGPAGGWAVVVVVVYRSPYYRTLKLCLYFCRPNNPRVHVFERGSANFELGCHC